MQLPAHFFEIAYGGFGYSFREVYHHFPGVGVYFCEGVSEGSDGYCVSIGVEGSDDGSFVAFRRGGIGVLSGGSVIANVRGCEFTVAPVAESDCSHTSR